jgi:RimJ/RimL family protein N-acetyltransferase
MYPARLVSDQVVLREFRPDDEDDVYAIVRDDRVTRWLSYDSRTPADARAMLAGAIERANLEPRTNPTWRIPRCIARS